MNRTSTLILIFAAAFMVMIIGPALLNQPFGPFPLIKLGDVFDVLSPIVLIPLYWLLYQHNSDQQPLSQRQMIVFLILAALWVEGQGMHLSANSIGHLLKGSEETDTYRLMYFYDEQLSHYLWHFGLIALSALLMWRSLQTPEGPELRGLWMEGIAAVIYGLTYFITVVEAQTTLIGVPFAILAALIGAWRGRGEFRRSPVLTFFVIAYAIACLLFLGWFIRWGGLPEFSEVGLID